MTSEKGAGGNAAETAGFPFPKIVLDPALTGFPEQPPRFPGGTRHDRDSRKLFVGVLRTIASTKRLDKTNDLTPFLEAVFHQGQINQMREQGVGGDQEMAAGNQDAQRSLSEPGEETFQVIMLVVRKNCEAGNGAACATIERGRKSPDSALTLAQLGFFDGREFL